jgi:uncharacterized protein (DUF3084 family)
MYIILFFTLFISLLVIIFFVRKNFSRKEVFLNNSIDQLRVEKKILSAELKTKEEALEHMEKDLFKSHQVILELRKKSERLEEENKALRKLLDALQRNQDTKKDDIIVEYFIKQ